MKTKTVQAGDNTITLQSMPASKYWALEEKRASEGNKPNLFRHTKQIVLNSIAEWSFTGPDGNTLEINEANVWEVITTDLLDAVIEAANEVNGLSPLNPESGGGLKADEKKT